MYHSIARSLMIYFPDSNKFLTTAKGIFKTVDHKEKHVTYVNSSIAMFCLIYKLKELESIPDKKILFGHLSFDDHTFNSNWNQFILTISKDMESVPIGSSKITRTFPYVIHFKKVSHDKIEFFIAFIFNVFCKFITDFVYTFFH